MLLRYRFFPIERRARARTVPWCLRSDGGCRHRAAGACLGHGHWQPNERPRMIPQASAGVMSRFTATDLEGVEVTSPIFSDYKLTMVNVWATFCTPCINEMPDLGELAAEYSDQGVRIVGLVLDTLDSDGSISESQVETAKEIVDQTGAGLPAPAPLARPVSYSVRHHRRTDHVFVDSTGAQVGHAIVTAQSKDAWIETIDSMLAEVEA